MELDDMASQVKKATLTGKESGYRMPTTVLCATNKMMIL